MRLHTLFGPPLLNVLRFSLYLSKEKYKKLIPCFILGPPAYHESGNFENPLFIYLGPLVYSTGESKSLYVIFSMPIKMVNMVHAKRNWELSMTMT